jgi:hypothetical protein
MGSAWDSAIALSAFLVTTPRSDHRLTPFLSVRLARAKSPAPRSLRPRNHLPADPASGRGTPAARQNAGSRSAAAALAENSAGP